MRIIIGIFFYYEGRGVLVGLLVCFRVLEYVVASNGRVKIGNNKKCKKNRLPVTTYCSTAVYII